MTAGRGTALQAALAVWLRGWWPAATSVKHGRGIDIENTPGVVFESKTAYRFDPAAWSKQAAGYARDGQIPVTVYWPNGVGAQRPERTLFIFPAEIGMRLLQEAGYVPERGGE